jgi:DNA repair protein RadA/Sms
VSWARLTERAEDDAPRFSTGLEGLDRVLGGGVVPGGVTLLAGEPGIGKSTLLLQAAESLSRRGQRSVYVSAEESPRQIRLRAERMGCLGANLAIAGETRLEEILAGLGAEKASAAFVDSIQTLRAADLDSPAGSISQVRWAAERLVDHAKTSGTALFLVSHVTKDGAIAGPKSLEHLVDTVLSFEGNGKLAGTGELRLLRATKNRFGPTGEIALYAMHDNGLEPVAAPSRALLARRRSDVAGSAVAASLQGSRPLLVEIQSLVGSTRVASPRRTALGLDGPRLALLVAVLERYAGAALSERDLFLNVVGGVDLGEPATDLPAAAAILSALAERPLPKGAVFAGEIGLLGEVRPVGGLEARLREAAQHGFTQAFVASSPSLRDRAPLELVELEHVGHLAALLGGPRAPDRGR